MPRTRPLRVAMASAHYPPNFVSGGTLVPQRSARGMVSRGHEVGVFAGWLGDEHPEFDTWDETDAQGVAVRWVATWFGWSDRRNYDNPEVARRFGAWLDEFRPDVVHLHSLQTLGAGLVHEAADRAIPVVVTLHDFWWWCARQFLSDRNFMPCCPVVDAGACRCEVDRPWLEERNGFTARALARVSRVITVSHSAARVANANGVDERRLVVIEPGTDADSDHRPSPARREEAQVLRLLFAGGSNREKGIDVLTQAGRLLGEQAGWQLTCYGCEEVSEELRGLPVEVRPAFAPSELEGVLERSDVVVIPSVVHESFSTLTREAIARGVPVVCSASLGPEEVVEDGVNGLVVPAGDAGALAGAIGRLLDDPELLPRLRRGCTSVELSTLDEHLDQLLSVYYEVLDRPRLMTGRVHRVTRVLFVVGIDGAPLRYRAHLPAEALGSLGVHCDVRHYLNPDISRLGEDADVVVVYRVPATIQVLQFLAGVRGRGTPVVFDIDDLIFDPTIGEEIPALRTLTEDEATLYWQGVRRYRTTMEHADAFVGSTEPLCDHAAAVTRMPAHLFANGVGRVLGRLSDEALHRPRLPGPPRIGYLSGTSTHAHDWRFVEPAVAEVLGSHPDLELWLVGLVEPSPELERFGPRVRRRGMLDWTRLPGLLRDLDVNLAPLEPSNMFNEAKSPIKWLEAALCATPTIASPTGPFRQAVRHGANGLLAGDAQEWVAAMSLLVEDQHARGRIGARARRDVLLELAPALQGRRYLSIIEQVTPRSITTSTWVPEAPDEPQTPYAVDPYPPKRALAAMAEARSA
ncbi:MAG: glycosyltransferase [Acidimicrobiales bacterium]